MEIRKMETRGIGMGTSPNITGVTGVGKELGKETFLNLLLTQLKHQDPLDPQDSTGMVAQLVQFSNLEQLTGLNKQMEELKSIQADTRERLVVSYLGKNVLFQSNTFQVSKTEPVSLHYWLTQEAKEVRINIRRADGELVNVISIGPQKAEDHQFLFTPEDDQKKPLAEGEYLFEVEATDRQGEKVSAFTLSQGRVTGVMKLLGVLYVMVGDLKVPLEDVIRVQE